MTNNLNKLAEGINILPCGDSLVVEGWDGYRLPIHDLKALVASWERRGEALENILAGTEGHAHGSNDKVDCVRCHCFETARAALEPGETR